MATIKQKEFEEFFQGLEENGHFVPEKVGDMFYLTAPGGYSAKTVYVVDKITGNLWGDDSPLEVVAHRLNDRPDSKGIWPTVGIFPNGCLQHYADSGMCHEYRASKNIPEVTGPSTHYTVEQQRDSRPIVTKHSSTRRADSQQETDKPLPPQHLHPDLICDIDYSASEYQWPPLPRGDPGPEMLELGLFDGLVDFFKDLDEAEEGQNGQD